MDYNITARIWDSFFVEGEAYAMKVSLGILKYYEMELRLSTFHEADNLLKKLPSNSSISSSSSLDLNHRRAPSSLPRQQQS